MSSLVPTIEDYKNQARALGYYLIAGTDEDDWTAIARLIPSTPHTKAALRDAHPDADAIHAECAFSGDELKPLAISQAVEAALTAARSIN